MSAYPGGAGDGAGDNLSSIGQDSSGFDRSVDLSDALKSARDALRTMRSGEVVPIPELVFDNLISMQIPRVGRERQDFLSINRIDDTVFTVVSSDPKAPASFVGPQYYMRISRKNKVLGQEIALLLRLPGITLEGELLGKIERNNSKLVWFIQTNKLERNVYDGYALLETDEIETDETVPQIARIVAVGINYNFAKNETVAELVQRVVRWFKTESQHDALSLFATVDSQFIDLLKHYGFHADDGSTELTLHKADGVNRFTRSEVDEMEQIDGLRTGWNLHLLADYDNKLYFLDRNNSKLLAYAVLGTKRPDIIFAHVGFRYGLGQPGSALYALTRVVFRMARWFKRHADQRHVVVSTRTDFETFRDYQYANLISTTCKMVGFDSSSTLTAGFLQYVLKLNMRDDHLSNCNFLYLDVTQVRLDRIQETIRTENEEEAS